MSIPLYFLYSSYHPSRSVVRVPGKGNMFCTLLESTLWSHFPIFLSWTFWRQLLQERFDSVHIHISYSCMLLLFPWSINYSYLFLFTGKSERDRETELERFSSCWLSKWSWQPGLLETEARSQKLRPDIQHGWQRLKYLNHYLLFPRCSWARNLSGNAGWIWYQTFCPICDVGSPKHCPYSLHHSIYSFHLCFYTSSCQC